MNNRIITYNNLKQDFFSDRMAQIIVTYYIDTIFKGSLKCKARMNHWEGKFAENVKRWKIEPLQS